MKKTLVLLIACIILCSCAQNTSVAIIGGADGPTSITVGKITDEGEKEMHSYEIITQDKAKEIMDSDTPCVILDVREESEYNEGHIPGAVVIPHEKVSSVAESLIPNKSQLILVYCRSGRRSKIASDALANLGYTNVKEFGGIIDWKYDIVK